MSEEVIHWLGAHLTWSHPQFVGEFLAKIRCSLALTLRGNDRVRVRAKGDSEGGVEGGSEGGEGEEEEEGEEEGEGEH